MSSTKAISADSHVQENDDLFKVRVPEEYRRRVPHKETIDGGVYTVSEGRKNRRADIAASKVNEDDLDREFRQDPSGGTDINRRLSDQDKDGVLAEVIYPNSLLGMFASPDPDYQFAVAKAYNDWVIDLFGTNQDRFAPAAIVPVIDVDRAVTEVKRIANNGFRLISSPIHLKDRPYSLPVYEPLWDVLEETGLPISLHFISGSEDHLPEDAGEEERGGFLTYMIAAMAEGITPATTFVSSGVVQRHPDFHFAIVECGAGWLPWVLYTMDDQYDRKHMWIEPKLDMRPSELFKRQGHTTFSDDPVALRMLDYIGTDALMWGSDYPHDEGTFPNSQSVIDETFSTVTEAQKQKIVYGNAAKLYNFPKI